jgi:uncharacterized protein with FMN-binding domain
VRKSTAFLSSLVAASSLTVAWSIGQSTLGNSSLLPLDVGASPAPTSTATATAGPSASETSPAATTDPAATNSASATPSATQTTQTTQTNKPTPSATQTNKPTPSATQAPPGAAVAPVVFTVSSDTITYKYGVVQVSMTKTNGQITNITMLQGDATNGRAQAYVSLIDATIQVQGTNYGNVAGATFTTDAFKKAIDNVLKKF